jgi:hypothetical protein
VTQLPSPGGIRLVLAFECVRSLVKQSSYQTLPILPEGLKSPLGSEEVLLVPNNDIRPTQAGRMLIAGLGQNQKIIGVGSVFVVSSTAPSTLRALLAA